MARLKIQFINLFFILMIYFWTVIGLVMVTELESSATKDFSSEVVSAELSSRPVVPRHDITSQRLAPLDIDSELPPFWSR